MKDFGLTPKQALTFPKIGNHQRRATEQGQTRKYKEEQGRHKTEITVTEELIDRQREDSDRFAAPVEEQVDIPEPTAANVNEFVKMLLVHEADKSGGHRRQTVEIVIN